MTKKEVRDLLRKYKEGKVTEQEIITTLSTPKSEHLGFATLDNHRQFRKGFPEVIYCERKTPQQVAEIAAAIIRKKQPLLATRASEEHYNEVKKKIKRAIYYPSARIITLGKFPPATKKGTVLIITAGTSDIPVAEEAAITLQTLGNPVEKLYDVGVAGIHRLFEQSDLIFDASVIIVVAGMEGALPSVVGGLVDVPVIAVPTSVGYGTSFQGIAALLAMLNSCASGITVVNIDNGYGAAYAAHLMNK